MPINPKIKGPLGDFSAQEMSNWLLFGEKQTSSAMLQSVNLELDPGNKDKEASIRGAPVICLDGDGAIVGARWAIEGIDANLNVSMKASAIWPDVEAPEDLRVRWKVTLAETEFSNAVERNLGDWVDGADSCSYYSKKKAVDPAEVAEFVGDGFSYRVMLSPVSEEKFLISLRVFPRSLAKIVQLTASKNISTQSAVLPTLSARWGKNKLALEGSWCMPEDSKG